MIQDDELRDLFRIESEEHLQKLDEGLLHLEKVPDDQERLDEVFREAHSMKGASRMLGVEGVEQLSHLLEDRLGQAKRGENQLDSETIDRIYLAVDAIRDLVEEAVTGKGGAVDVVAVSDVLTGRLPLPTGKSAAPATQPPASPPSGAAAEPAVPLEEPENQSAPVAQTAGPEPATAPVTSSADQEPAPPPVAAEASVPEPPPPQQSGALQTPPTGTPAAVASTPAPGGQSAEAPAARSGDYRIETIRINTERLDALLNQAGELTVAAQRVGRRPDDIEEIVGFWEEWNRASVAQRRLLTDLEASVGRYSGSDSAAAGDTQNSAITDRLREYLTDERERLERLSGLLDKLKQESAEDATKLELIADRLEDDIRDARMLPLSTLFGLFPRTVRDLAREEGKEIEFIVEGGETRADKRIVEEMKDPLMHLLRNAVDHGLETPAEREGSGKARTARLILRGRQQGRNVAVEIQDDGRGLDPARITQVALDRGVITQEQAAQLSAEQAYELFSF